MGFKKNFVVTPFLLIFCLFIGPFMAANAYDFASGVFKFQQKLAAQGNAQAQYKLANMYANGQGVKANLNEALIWYKKSAAQNYAPAATRITYIDIRQNGYKPSKHKKWLNKLKNDADKNDGESLFLLGTLYKKGFIVPKNYSKAADLFRRASNKNIPGAETERDNVEAILKKQNTKQLQLKAEKKRKEQKQLAIQKQKQENEKNKQKSNKQRVERERLANEQERAAIKRVKQTRLEERQQLIGKRRALLLKQAQAQAQTQALAAEQRKKQSQKNTDSEEVIPEVVKKKKSNRSICKGSKARFLTICR